MILARSSPVSAFDICKKGSGFRQFAGLGIGLVRATPESGYARHQRSRMYSALTVHTAMLERLGDSHVSRNTFYCWFTIGVGSGTQDWSIQ